MLDNIFFKIVLLTDLCQSPNLKCIPTLSCRSNNSIFLQILNNGSDNIVNEIAILFIFT